MRLGSVAVALFVVGAACGCSDRQERELVGSTQQAVAAPLPAAFCTIDVNGASKDARPTTCRM